MFKRKSEEKSDWTLETLYIHLTTLINSNDVKYNQRFEASQAALPTALVAQKLAVDTALAAADRAVIKAETAAEKRFESVNEFRASLADQQRTLMPRSEAELLIKTLSDKIEANTANLTTVAGQKSGMKDLWGYLIGAIGIVLALYSYFHK